MTAPRQTDDTGTGAMKLDAIPLGRHWRWIIVTAAILYWLAMFIGTHIPPAQLGSLATHSDKVLHFTAYAGLSFLLGLWRSTMRQLTWRDYRLIFAITFVYSVADELTQELPFIGRDGDILDAIADWTGSAVGLLCVYGFLALRRRKRSDV